MLTNSTSKGAFAPVWLEGATIREDRRSLVAIYGRAAVMQAALSGRLPSAASSSVLFGCRRWNRAKKVDPLSAPGRLRTYVPHGEIGALRATFLDERRIVSAEPRPDKAQFQDRQSAEPCATLLPVLSATLNFPCLTSSAVGSKTAYL